MHYEEITAEVKKKYREEGNWGSTPERTVSYVLTTSKNKGDGKLIFKKETKPGFYSLKSDESNLDNVSAVADEEVADSSLNMQLAKQNAYEQVNGSISIVKSYGVFWKRSEVDWNLTSVNLSGKRRKDWSKGESVDFRQQIGIYILYDHRDVVYVGQTKKSLGNRLKAHCEDRHMGRWNRFSWFGLKPVSDDGTLLGFHLNPDLKEKHLTNALEGILIEVLQAGGNRRAGDGFSAIEFIQCE